MDNYLKTYCKDYNMPDLWVYYSGITKDQADEILDIDDVDQIEARYTYDVSVNYDDRASVQADAHGAMTRIRI